LGSHLLLYYKMKKKNEKKDPYKLSDLNRNKNSNKKKISRNSKSSESSNSYYNNRTITPTITPIPFQTTKNRFPNQQKREFEKIIEDTSLAMEESIPETRELLNDINNAQQLVDSIIKKYDLRKFSPTTITPSMNIDIQDNIITNNQGYDYDYDQDDGYTYDNLIQISDGDNKVKINLSKRKPLHFGMEVDEKMISHAYCQLEQNAVSEYQNCTPQEEDELYKQFSESTINLETLIQWGDLYHQKQKAMCGRISLKQLYHLQEPLKALNNMIGLQQFKLALVEQILMCLQGLHRNPTKQEDEMFHTVIYGPPGVGKTQLAKILGHIYITMGLIYKRSIDLTNFKIDDYFQTAGRSDLIGMYCGHTAVQTQKIIDECRKQGKVLFIDETYSLGDKEGRDNFSKECLDTINKNLTEGAGEFICIITGYPEDIKKCFFAHNKGLERRFNFRYTVDKYDPNELLQIFLLKLKECDWGIDNDNVITTKFFETNSDYFANYGGDIVAFITKCKIIYAKRVFSLKEATNRKLIKDDIESAFEIFKSERQESVKQLKEKREKEEKEKEREEHFKGMMYS